MLVVCMIPTCSRQLYFTFIWKTKRFKKLNGRSVKSHVQENYVRYFGQMLIMNSLWHVTLPGL